MKIFDKPKNTDGLSIIGEMSNSKIGRCWSPGIKCNNTPIRAHSVQNANVLDKIQLDGHVIGIESFLDGGELHTGFRKIGRNKATTFRGLCSEHDNEFFTELDAGNLDLEDTMVCALLTWRAITHEMAEKMDVAYKFQKQYDSKIKSGEIDGNTPDSFGMEAVLWLKVLYDFHHYREEFLTPHIFLEQQSQMIYKSYVIENTGPVLASASFFVIDSGSNKQTAHVAVNVFPKENDTYVLFSVCRKELGRVMPVVRGLLTRKKLCPIKFSAFLLSRVQNFVLAPKHFSKWGEEKVNLIESVFSSTVLNEEWIEPRDELNLFN